MVKKQANFIELSGSIFLQRPTSVGSGQARHLWFARLTSKQPTIAHPDYWIQLVQNNRIKTLVEYEDGSWEIQLNRNLKREKQGFCAGCHGCICPCGRREGK